jgi:hypothetical protein
MEIRQAISSYYDLVRQAFSKPLLGGEELFSTTQLKVIIRSIVEKFAKNENAPLVDDENSEGFSRT